MTQLTKSVSIGQILKLNFKVKSVISFCLDPQWHCAPVVSIIGLILEHDSAIVNKYFPHRVNGKGLGLCYG